MKGRHWKSWIAGIALAQLVVLGVVVAMLWPMPSEAEQAAARLCEGMKWHAIEESLRSKQIISDRTSARYWWRHPDGSALLVSWDWDGAGEQILVSFRATAAAPVPALDRLRGLFSRFLARVTPGARK
jgi:hypothetical protein